MKNVLDYKPREIISNRMEFPMGEPEMTKDESAFLCGLINSHDTNCIVELGIAAGATTAIITQCLENKGKPYQFYAVDYSEKFYRDSSKQSGWFGENAKEVIGLKHGKVSFLLGKAFPYLMDGIKPDKIDFILLDTMHVIPGEILDFLFVLPFLSENAIVCLHDISLNLHDSMRNNEIATNVLFNGVVADKVLCVDLNGANGYPNIGAFRIIPDTRKYIKNIFGMLTLNWTYIPPHDEIMKYRGFYCENYDSECIEIFDRAYDLNKNISTTLYRKLRKIGRIVLKGRL